MQNLIFFFCWKQTTFNIFEHINFFRNYVRNFKHDSKFKIFKLANKKKIETSKRALYLK